MSDFTNPFGDPSVQQARQIPSNGGNAAAATTEFNPFGTTNRSTVGSAVSQPAVLKTELAGPPPAYSTTPAQRINMDELERRQRELEARARELDEKEELQRQQQARNNKSNRVNNWPPLPSCFPVQPCFYQDIELDIPGQFQRYVRLAYYLWMAHAVLLLLNIGGTMAAFIMDSNSAAGATFGVSLLIFGIVTPCSFVCWYRPLYKAFRSDSSFNFFVFFFVMLIQAGILIIQCLGIDMLGSSGWINGLRVFKSNQGAGIMMLLIAAMFTTLAVLDIMLLIRVHRIYRSTGASFEKAKAEFRTGVSQNEAVRGVASDLGSAAAHGAMSGATRN